MGIAVRSCQAQRHRDYVAINDTHTHTNRPVNMHRLSLQMTVVMAAILVLSLVTISQGFFVDPSDPKMVCVDECVKENTLGPCGFSCRMDALRACGDKCMGQ